MNELQVLIDRVPGALVWSNYPEIVAELDRMLEEYKGIAYTEETIRDAKADRATLNKLKGEIEDARKRVKKAWEEPYKAIEEKAKSLTRMIDAQIGEIDKSINEYEDARKEKAKEEVMAFLEETVEGFPEAVRKTFKWATYDSRWLNKTAKKSEWQKTITDAAEKTMSELKCIREMAEEETEADIAIQAYAVSLSLTDAISKLNELKRQKEVVRANVTKEMLARDDEKAVEKTVEPFPEGFDKIPDDGGLDELMNLLAEEPEKSQRKVLCIHGKGDDMRKVQALATELGLNVWYQMMD